MQKLPDKALPQAGICFQRFRHQIFKIDDFCPLFPQDRGKCIMFLPSKSQIRDIVKEQPLQLLRDKVFQFFARSVKQDFF